MSQSGARFFLARVSKIREELFSYLHIPLLFHTRCAACTGASVASYLTKCTKDLMDLTDLVRGNLSYQDRTTLGALITVDVHARDVVQELSDAGVGAGGGGGVW